MNLFENRVESFHNNTVKWPHTQKNFHKPETFARAGLYFTRRPKMTDTLKCFLCKVELSQWKQGQSPFTRHAYESPDCPWVVLDFPDNPSHDLDVDQTTAKGTRMRSMRLATFTRHNYWPPKKKAQKALPSATKIANAGFYFAPTREHPTRVRCPYCHSEIMDPSKIEDIIEEHKKLNKECIFFKNTRSSRSRLSLATSEARSALSASKDNPSSEANPENDIWSIDTTFTSAPKLTRKSRLVTYSKRESRKRRDTGLSSSSKSISKKSKDVKRPKIIVHETSPSPSDATNDSNSDELIIQNVPSQQKKLSTFIPTHTTHVDTSMDEPSDNIVASRTTSPGRSKVRVLKQIDDNQEEPIISIKKDKGKGRQIEPTMASIRPLAKKNLSLSKNKTRTNDPYILINDPSSHQPVGSSSSTSSSHGSNDSSTGISNSHPFHHVIPTPPHSQTLFSRDTEPLDDLTNQQSGAYVFDVESLDDETTSIQQLNEPLQFMQSTPAQSSQMEVDAHDIFGSRPCSPIEPKNGTIEGSIGDTPVTSYREEGGRTRRLITFEEGEAKLIRHWSPSTSPSVPALNMHEEHVSDEIMAELDDEQKKMTVEQYTLSLIEQSIQIIKEKGYEKIEQIEKEAERRRREILSRQLL